MDHEDPSGIPKNPHDQSVLPDTRLLAVARGDETTREERGSRRTRGISHDNQAERHRRGETDEDPFEAYNPFRQGR
jgi:hypothetical protein